MSSRPLPPRAAELIAALGLQPHPEGGHYREIHRSPAAAGTRAALTSIDFLLVGANDGLAADFSAWHRVDADEAWHLLEGAGLTLWLMPPDLSRLQRVELGPVEAPGTMSTRGDDAPRRPRHVVPAGWWQAAEPQGPFAYVGATVGPGFEFAGFTFGRDDAALASHLQGSHPDLVHLL